MPSTSSRSSLCDIVIPIWNQPVLTKRCLDAVLRHTPEPVTLVLIDNGSGPATKEPLLQFQRENPLTVLIRNEENLGFIRASNQGIRAGSSEWVCLLNNDTVVTARWLGEMLEVANRHPQIGLLNPTSNSLGFRPGALSIDAYAKDLQRDTGRMSELPSALGFCLLAHRKLLEEVGLLDETFGMGNFDDDDLSRKVKAKGYLCARACASYVYHEEKASFRELPGWKRAFEENRRKFENRWGRPLRILCDRIPEEAAVELLEQDHWLYFLGKREEIPGAIASRAQVAALGVGEPFRRLKAALRILWRRKKPFHLIVSFDPQLCRWLAGFRWAMPAELLENPSADQLVDRCKKLSQSPS